MVMVVPGILTEDLVHLDLAATTENEAIRAVAALLDGAGGVVDFRRFCEEVIERERVSSTAAGHGVAFPHARTDAVRQIVVAIGRSRKGIRFQNGQQVHFIVIIGTPTGMVREYLNIVGKLAHLFRESAVRERLMQAETPAEFLAQLPAFRPVPAR
jgi:mannitol/fructose-specific phosphotransferase system IIA component (Ntr-type)